MSNQSARAVVLAARIKQCKWDASQNEGDIRAEYIAAADEMQKELDQLTSSGVEPEATKEEAPVSPIPLAVMSPEKVVAPAQYAALDVPRALASLVIREAVINASNDITSEGDVVTEFQPNGQYSVSLELADTDGVHYSSNPPSFMPMDVDKGTENFDRTEGVRNFYAYRAPSFVASDTTATFTTGRYTDTADTTLITVDFSFPLKKSDVVAGGSDLPNLGALKGAPFVEGYGSDTVGGRGQTVQVASNASEFEQYWEGSAPGIILFDFAGDIEPSSKMVQGGPNKTVYGQTARGEGIQIFKPTGEDKTSLQVDYSETILQHLRLRAGKETSVSDFVRGLDVNRGNRTINGFLSYHNDYSWGTDQGISVWYSTTNVGFWGDMFAEPLHHGGHGFNFLVGSNCDQVSVNRTYFGVGVDRNPQMQMNKNNSKVQMANLVISGYGRAMLLRCKGSGSTSYFNVENCLWQEGPNSSGSRGEIEIGVGEAGDVRLYQSGNRVMANGKTIAANPGDLQNIGFTAFPDSNDSISSDTYSSSRYDMPSVQLLSLSELDSLVVDQAGATPARRDATTARIMAGYATNADYVYDEDRRVMASGPTRLDTSRADKTSAEFRAQYNIADSVNCLTTEDGNGQGWTLFEQFMYWLEQQPS